MNNSCKIKFVEYNIIAPPRRIKSSDFFFLLLFVQL